MDGTKQGTRLQTIRVNWVDLRNPEGEFVAPEAWRISYWHDGSWKTFGTKHKHELRAGFARRRDAEMAMAALINEGLGTAESVLENRAKAFTTAVEAMAW
jgi:hypothetical protein